MIFEKHSVNFLNCIKYSEYLISTNIS